MHLTTAADGISLAYDFRKGSPTTHVYVHGWCGHRGLWGPLVSSLPANYGVLRLDLAGHGGSGGGRRRYSMAAFGDDVVRCVEAAVEGSVVLVGHSMAGDVIVDAALKLGRRVLGLVGVDTLWNVGREIEEALIEQTLEPFCRDYPRAASDYGRSMFLPGAAPDLIDRVVGPMATASPGVGVGALEEVLRNRPALRLGLMRLRRLGVPMRLINSEDWRETDDASAKQFGLHVVRLRGVGHFSMLEEPAAVAREIHAASAAFHAA